MSSSPSVPPLLPLVPEPEVITPLTATTTEIRPTIQDISTCVRHEPIVTSRNPGVHATTSARAGTITSGGDWQVWQPSQPEELDQTDEWEFVDEEVPAVDNGPEATYASRNPHRKMIPVSHKSTRQSKFTALKSREELGRKRIALLKDLKRFREWRDAEIRVIAQRHSQRPEYIRRLVLRTTLFKVKHRPTLRNALVHYKAKELNEGLPPGHRKKLKEIQIEVAKDATLKNLSPERQQELIDALVEQREVKELGVRSTNKGATLDFIQVTKQIQWEMGALHERTGITGFAFFSRGHINDSMYPTWIDCGKGLQFISDILKTTPHTFGRKFETWAVAQKDGKNYAETLKELQKDCALLISTGLNRIMNRQNMEMQYLHYKTNICLRHRIKLRGWPDGVQFQAPSRISSWPDLMKLQAALRCGECAWTDMPLREWEDLSASLQGQPPVQRATRKDKGTKRGKRKQVGGDVVQDGVEQDECENEPSGQRAAKRPRKRMAKQLPPSTFTSAKRIEDSD